MTFTRSCLVSGSKLRVSSLLLAVARGAGGGMMPSNRKTVKSMTVRTVGSEVGKSVYS